jgi:hypothetical protein
LQYPAQPAYRVPSRPAVSTPRQPVNGVRPQSVRGWVQQGFTAPRASVFGHQWGPLGLGPQPAVQSTPGVNDSVLDSQVSHRPLPTPTGFLASQARPGSQLPNGSMAYKVSAARAPQSTTVAQPPPPPPYQPTTTQTTPASIAQSGTNQRPGAGATPRCERCGQAHATSSCGQFSEAQIRMALDHLRTAEGSEDYKAGLKAALNRKLEEMMRARGAS